MQLTDHFDLGEFTRSGVAVSMDVSNAPDAAQVAALTGLCEHLLEPLRAHYSEDGAEAVRILSGFTVPAINEAIGRSPHSQHCLGEAADIAVGGELPLAVCRWIVANLDFDRVILERGEGAAQWIHLSWRAEGRRGETFTAELVDGAVVYVPGLPE